MGPWPGWPPWIRHWESLLLLSYYALVYFLLEQESSFITYNIYGVPNPPLERRQNSGSPLPLLEDTASTRRCLQTIRNEPDYSPSFYRVTEVIQYSEIPKLLLIRLTE